MNQAQKDNCTKATQRIANVEFLAKRPEFIDMMEHFRNRADSLANQVLHDDMDAVEREKLRNFRMGILEFLKYPIDEITASKTILRGYGEMVGD